MSTSNSSYPVSRKNHKRYEGRTDYLTDHIRSVSPQLCQVMQNASDLTRSAQNRDRPSVRTDADGNPLARVWEGLPWLTLVFGSGALKLPRDAGRTAASLAAAVVNKLPDSADSSLSAPSGERLFAFTSALVRDRTGEVADAHGSPAAPPAELKSPMAAQLIDCASLLTELFHRVQVLNSNPIGRWDDDQATFHEPFEDDGLQHLVEDVQDAIDAALDAVREARADATLERITEAVEVLLKELRLGLDPKGRERTRSLRVDRVRLLTEVAWFALSHGTPIYPGWTDLLLALTLQEGNRGSREFRRPRPRFPNLRQLPALVSEVYREPTKLSWSITCDQVASSARGPVLPDPPDSETGVPAEVTRRDHLYWAAAEVLWQQSEAITTAGPGVRLPPAAAFVTSFDVELDMALLATARGRMFRVAVPVHLVRKSASDGPAEAELCWLLGDVPPREGELSEEHLAHLLRPSNWRLLTPEFDQDELRRAPIVIHLSGCPLFEIPRDNSGPGREAFAKLHASLKTVGLERRPQEDRFDHAVTVDEYLALRQSEAELIWFGADNNAKPGARRSRELHPDLVTNLLTNPRYWVAMGVPVSDSAVRHRLVTQLTRQRLAQQSGSSAGAAGKRMQGNPRPRPSSSPEVISHIDGVAINRRIGDDETNLLYWVGMDVVEDDCYAFVRDLHHYARHVQFQDADVLPSVEDACPLLEDPRG